ncbi:hypothetical protein [Nocardia sp. NPDC046763]|uniref:hypothetical protein n=1 Tax=Nocardia sp. NPDC046763 TaxID=3155256 RepID=UPI0033D24E5E
MDPNEVLRIIRELITEFDELRDVQDRGDSELVIDKQALLLLRFIGNFEDLDKWLRRGGFLPGAWSQNRASAEEPEQWIAERDYLVGNHNSAVEALAELTDECDQLAHDLHHAEYERDELRSERDGVRWERDQLESDLTQLRWDHDDLERDHAALTRERDELHRQLAYVESQLPRFQHGGAW